MHTLILAAVLVAQPQLRTTDDLINGLGSDDFDAREKAQAALTARGWPVYRALKKAAADNKDVEIRRRAADVAGALLEDRLRHYEPYPMIDALWYDPLTTNYNCRHDAYFNFHHYLDAVGRDQYPYHNYRLAAKNLTRDWLDAGVPDIAIKMIHKIMRQRDHDWLEHHKRELKPWDEYYAVKGL